MIREYLQKILIRFIVKDVFHSISPEDILVVGKKGVWFFRGKELGPEMVERLQADAKVFSDSTLWKVLKAELQWSASKTLLEKGNSATDIRIAQIQGYITKVIDEKLQSMKS